MSGEVRLSKHAPSVWVESQIGNYIALPAAQHAALVALLEELQEYLDTGIVDVARAVALSNRVTQALSGQTRDQQPGRAGGGS